jgi:hypothetical protein
MRLLLALAFVVLAACGDDPAPLVEVISATPDQLFPDDDARDDLVITVRYDDADGDLGTGVAEVHDCRGDALVSALAIPAIAPPGIAGSKRITGTLELHVTDVGDVPVTELAAVCADLAVAPLPASETVFCVILVDAAGHRGPGDCTGAIGL